jgi:hypothetical protein
VSEEYDDIRRETEEAANSAGLPDDSGDELTLEVGESWVGRFRRRDVDADFDRPIYLLLDPDGSQRFVRGRTVLDNQMEAASPAAGDLIGIARRENRLNAEGQEYHDYTVRSRPASGLPAIAGEPPQPEPPAEGGQLDDSEELPFLCRDELDPRSAPAAVAGTG